RLSILASLLGVGAPRAEKGRKMHSGRRHAGMQEMILKDRKWTAKAIQEFRERKVAKDTVVKAEATSAEGAQGDSGQNAALKPGAKKELEGFEAESLGVDPLEV
ncbi:unnamed protein product, partial [Durusdinium trenchii]